jgi:hypothetical protein
MVRQAIVNKLREIANEIEYAKEGSIATWHDFELERLVIVGRPAKGEPFSPVIIFDTDLGEIRRKETETEGECKTPKFHVKVDGNYLIDEDGQPWRYTAKEAIVRKAEFEERGCIVVIENEW